MNNLYISLIIAAGITFFAVITKPKDQSSNQSSFPNSYSTYGLKIYVISFIISYVALTYLLVDNIKQIIDTGEADF